MLGRAGLPGAASGVPMIGALAMNVTVTDSESPSVGGGYVTVFPCGTRPDASNLNFIADQTIANAVIAPISAQARSASTSTAPPTCSPTCRATSPPPTLYGSRSSTKQAAFCRHRVCCAATWRFQQCRTAHAIPRPQRRLRAPTGSSASGSGTGQDVPDQFVRHRHRMALSLDFADRSDVPLLATLRKSRLEPPRSEHPDYRQAHPIGVLIAVHLVV